MVKTCALVSIFSIILSLLLIQYSKFEENPSQTRSQRNLKSPKASLFFPWEKPEITTTEILKIPNNFYNYTFSYLEIDSTNDLNISDYSCQPVSFGFSLQDGNKIFPEYHYPDCSNITDVKLSRLFIDRKSNLLTLDCEFPSTGYFFSGPLLNKTLMRKSSTSKFKLKKYSTAISAENISFAAGLCSESPDLDIEKSSLSEFKKYDIDPALFQHGDMKPIFNQNLYNEKLSFVQGKPRIIFMLTLDSISRRHFYRKLPKLVKYLNESENNLPHMAVYDFQLHSTFGSDSVHNQVPIFNGKPAQMLKKEMKNKDGLGNSSIWYELKNNGFLTVMGFDDCDTMFPEYVGQNPDVDYSIRQFYCLVDIYGEVRSAKQSSEQRCFGRYQTHHYILKYALDLVAQYQGVNMWVYLHLNAGHEQTGQHANTLDNDVIKFLKDLFFLTKDKSDIFMFLGADHGMRYGEWLTTIEAHQETLLPSLFIIADKTLLEHYPYSYHSLSENTKRLTSKLDIRKTIFSLARIPTSVPYGVDLIKEIANYSRDCKDLHSNILFCACNAIQEVKEFNDSLNLVLKNITKRIEKGLNKMSYFFPNYSEGQFCDKIVLDRLEKFFHIGIDNSRELFKLQYGSSLFSRFRLQANLVVSFSKKKLIQFKSKFKTIRLFFKDFDYYAKVLFRKVIYVARLDKYDGKCQRIAQENGVPPEFCLRSEC